MVFRFYLYPIYLKFGSFNIVEMAHWLKDFISLVYPNVCSCCDKVLNGYENCICMLCKYQLPRTQFHQNLDNPVNKLFWGRARINYATSCFHYQKGGKVQKLIHQLKYKGKKEIGEDIGRFHGRELINSPYFKEVEVILPVPLHPIREKQRGYNQSLFFAKGIAENMDKTYLPGILQRNSNTNTQTKKSRYDRWKNMNGIFGISSISKLIGKHILLVDDVVTTGATLEACAKEVLKIPDTRVSITTIAYVP